MTATLAGLLAAITGTPSLPGAQCRGRSHLFDPPHPDEPVATAEARQVQALSLCVRCPALTRCDTWLNSLTPADRPPGVVAGQVITTPTVRKTQPRHNKGERTK